MTAPSAHPGEIRHTPCCDDNRGLCGVDLTNDIDCFDPACPDCTPCDTCERMVEAMVGCGPKCVWGWHPERLTKASG